MTRLLEGWRALRREYGGGWRVEGEKVFVGDGGEVEVWVSRDGMSNESDREGEGQN